MAYEWKDKIVLITGAATAIGASVVRILMEENVKHVAVLDINEKAGVALQNELNKKYGNKVKFYKCDVTDDEQLVGCFKALVDEQGYIDVVVNNAGIMNDSVEVYKKMIQVNVTALCSGTLQAIDVMSKEKGGRGGTVINISSIVALFQSPCMVPIYHGTKSAVLQFSNCIGGNDYYPRTGVRVITMCFGATNTPLLHLDNLKSFDKNMEVTFPITLKGFVYQKQESAAQGLVDAYKQAESGSTWLATNDRPVEDISSTVNQAYGILSTQAIESAARGVVDAYKKGVSGSTWLSNNDRPAEDITANIKQAYDLIIESAARGVVDAYKKGVSGSTWLSNSDRPAEDITANIKQAYDLIIESAARGVVDAYKKGVSGSTWLSNSDRPAEDITANIKQAYDLMYVRVFQ